MQSSPSHFHFLGVLRSEGCQNSIEELLKVVAHLPGGGLIIFGATLAVVGNEIG